VEHNGRASSQFEDELRGVDPSQLQAYFSIGLGIKFLQLNRYDGAREQLCKGELLLAQAATQGARIPAPFLTWVQRQAEESVVRALGDANYSGRLKLRAGQPIPRCGQ
jgi:hypothetical protein